MRLSFEGLAAATPQSVWKQYDPQNWPNWDKGVTNVTLQGRFEPGTRGTMELEGEEPLEFEVAEVTDAQGFCISSTIPALGELRFDHRIAQREQATSICHTVELLCHPGVPLEVQLGVITNIFAGVPESVCKLIGMVQ